LPFLFSIYEVADIGTSIIAICKGTLAVRLAIDMISFVGITMGPIVFTLSFFQALTVHPLKNTFVRVQSSPIKDSRMSLAIYPVGRLRVSIGKDAEASTIPLPVSPLSDVPSIESRVFGFSDRLVVHHIAWRSRIPSHGRAKAKSHEGILRFRWQNDLKPIK
jgi:hypothetical protein